MNAIDTDGTVERVSISSSVRSGQSIPLRLDHDLHIDLFPLPMANDVKNRTLKSLLESLGGVIHSKVD